MSETTLKTPLYDLHVELNAKMAPFAGYQMPINYEHGVKKEHLHTREKAGLFDISHMGQIKLIGANASAALETLVPADIIDLRPGQQCYTLLTDHNGTILDDLMVSNIDNKYLFIVVNAACKNADLLHIQTKIGNQCIIENLNSMALLALQGPKAIEALSTLAPAVNDLVFMTGKYLSIEGVNCYVTRSGYTGEDGVEISVPNDHVEKIARKLLTHNDIAMIGLGARDSLRLEAGLCLYGHDIDNKTTPIEGSLIWSIDKKRREGGERHGNYPGYKIIDEQIQQKTSRKRVGLMPQGKAPIREGTVIMDNQQQPIGVVTSGGFSPSLNKPIAIGYVNIDHTDINTTLFAMVRGKARPMTVSTLPFVPHRYFRG